LLRGVFGALTDSYLAGNQRLTAIVRELERSGS
jgi:hypothetical protein